MADNSKGRGKGWHGDSRGHARAGSMSGGKFEAGSDRTIAAARSGGLASPTKFTKGDPRARRAGAKGGSH